MHGLDLGALTPVHRARHGRHSLLLTPVAVEEILAEFDTLFGDPVELPPRQECDHHVSLITGAQPVNVQPYHYAPHQKSEIEQQVQAMLAHGTIRRSSSPFASPVVLVRKKDGTWRFCVDYR